MCDFSAGLAGAECALSGDEASSRTGVRRTSRP